MIQKIKNTLHYCEQLKLSNDNIKREVLKLFIEDSDPNSLLLIVSELIQANKDRELKEKTILQTGLQDSMHNFSNISKAILNDDIKEAKNYVKMYFKPKNNNIAFISSIARAYFPDGISDGASETGKWFFEQFVKLLKNDPNMYINGDSKKWAEHVDIYDYLKLVLEKN